MWLARHLGEFAEAGALVVALSTDDIGAAAAVTRSLELPFPVLSDPDGNGAIRELGAWNEDEERALPALVVIAPDGREVFRHVSSDQADRGREPDALASVRALGLAPQAAHTGVHPHVEPRPTPKAYSRGDLHGFFYGIRSAANVLHRRTDSQEAARLRDMAEGYLKAL